MASADSVMNPTLKPERLEREQRLDPTRFAREYEAEFADDLEAFLPGQWVDDAVMRGRYQFPPRVGVRYVAAVDPSGGGADAFTMSIVHVEGQGAARRVVQDVMKGWDRKGSQAPDPGGVVAEIADVLRLYGLRAVTGDRYAGAWVRQAHAECRISYQEAPLDKSAAYLAVEPLFSQGTIGLLDHPQLVRELKTLEKRPRAGGRTQVDHPSGSSYHDDHANALALAAAVALQSGRSGLMTPMGAKRGAHDTAGPPGPTARPTITLAKPSAQAGPLPTTSPVQRDHF